MENPVETRPGVKWRIRGEASLHSGRYSEASTVIPTGLSKSPTFHLALFFDHQFVPNFPVLGFVAIVLKLGHLPADLDQGVQMRQEADVQFPKKPGRGRIPLPDRSEGIDEL